MQTQAMQPLTIPASRTAQETWHRLDQHRPDQGEFVLVRFPDQHTRRMLRLGECGHCWIAASGRATTARAHDHWKAI